MALNYPDILEHNNPNNPLMDVNQLKGVYAISLLVDRDTIPIAKRGLEQLVICKETGLAYTYLGNTTADIDWANEDNWSSGVDQDMLDLKAMQFVGLCKRINFKPTDIQIDSINNTVSISTVNSVPISENNPLRFFTDGAGIVVQHIITSPVSVSFTNTSGVWYVYFNSSGSLVCTQTPWSEFDTITTIYRFYLNATLSNSEKITVRAYEGHLNVMSSETHAVLHNGFGTIHINGFELIHNVLEVNSSGVPINSPNADGRNAVISLTSGNNSDDGLEYHVAHSTSPTLPFSQNLGVQSAVSLNATNSGLFKIRTNDVNGLLNFLPATRFPFAFNPTSNIPQFTTSTGVRTDVPDNHWFVYYVYALQDDKPGEPIKTVSAETSFTTFALAQNHDWLNLQLLYTTLRDKEIRPLYKLIFYSNYVVPNIFDVGTKFSGLVSVTDIRTFRPSTITTSGGGGGLVLASNVIVTPPSGYVATDQQAFDNEIAANTLKGNTTTHIALIDADSFGVWDSVGNVFKRIGAAAIKTYVKFGMKASEVLNDSTALGVTVKDVLDTADATEVQTVQDGDIIAMARDNSGVSENIFVKTENAKPYFAGAGNGTFIYVSTADEFVAAIGMEYSIIEICITKPIMVNPFSNVYADKVYLTGCEITLPDNIVLLTKTSVGTTTDYFIHCSIKYHVTDPASSAIVVTASDKIWNISARNFDNNELVAMSVIGAGSAVNLITGNTVYLNVPDSSGTYTATVDSTLDLGQGVESYTVYNESTLTAALASSKSEIVVNIIADISVTTFPQITPYKITFIGKRITITGGVLALSHSLSNNTVDMLFLNILAINKQASSIYSRITKSDTIVWNLTFRVLNYERVVAITSGGASGSINITTSNQLYLDTTESTGTYTTIYDYELDNTGFFYRSFSQQGYNQVRASITDSGHLTINCRLTFIKDEIGTVILLPQNSNISLHLRKITAVFLDADNPQTGDTYITGSITMPRFGGESEALPTFNLTGSTKGERHLYGENDGDGSTSYETGSEIAVLMENGDLLLNYTGGALGATQQNRAWYNIVITGHADTTAGNWTAI